VYQWVGKRKNPNTRLQHTIQSGRKNRKTYGNQNEGAFLKLEKDSNKKKKQDKKKKKRWAGVKRFHA